MLSEIKDLRCKLAFQNLFPYKIFMFRSGAPVFQSLRGEWTG